MDWSYGFFHSIPPVCSQCVGEGQWYKITGMSFHLVPLAFHMAWDGQHGSVPVSTGV